jgi:hypothetical protein
VTEKELSVPNYTATIRLLVEGTVDIKAPDEETAAKFLEEMDYVQVLNTIDVETDEVEILGDIEVLPDPE